MKHKLVVYAIIGAVAVSIAMISAWIGSIIQNEIQHKKEKSDPKSSTSSTSLIKFRWEGGLLGGIISVVIMSIAWKFFTDSQNMGEKSQRIVPPSSSSSLSSLPSSSSSSPPVNLRASNYSRQVLGDTYDRTMQSIKLDKQSRELMSD